MRIRWAAVALMIVAWVGGPASTAASGQPAGHTGGGTATARCGPATAKTIASDAGARVYAVGSGVYGCVNGRRAYLLVHRSQSRPAQSGLSEIALAGLVVGYAKSQSGVDTLSAEVVVRRLDSGRILHDVDAVRGPRAPEFFEGVDQLVVKADGAVAWIGRGGSILAKEGTVEVNRIDRRGEATLDQSTHHRMEALRLRGSKLSWRDGNALRTSTLL
jgi:hypothetical protein